MAWRFVDFIYFFFNDTATTEIYTLSLHDALPISALALRPLEGAVLAQQAEAFERLRDDHLQLVDVERLLDEVDERSEEHTSELQSRQYLVCRLLLEKKKKINEPNNNIHIQLYTRL